MHGIYNTGQSGHLHPLLPAALIIIGGQNANQAALAFVTPLEFV